MNTTVSIMGSVALAGGIGGFTSWLLPGGFRKKVKLVDAPAEAGWLALTFIGAVAATAAWMLGEKPSLMVVLGTADPNAAELSLALGDLAKALGIGLVGAKWLANFQSGQTLREVVSETALADKTPTLAARAPSTQARTLLAHARAARRKAH